MKIVISGYGRMGHEVEKVALERGHQIVATVDNSSEWETKAKEIKKAEMLIDFSLPETAIEVFENCFKLKIPIVTGTTGWYDKIEEVKLSCERNKAAFFYAPNFSIGVNVFFEANKKLANMLSKAGGYRPALEETHHIHKLDSPSGTAIRTAEDIIDEFEDIRTWKNNVTDDPAFLSIVSKREGEVNGDHSVTYSSDVDEIKISHSAKSRKGFALGAVVAAEFLLGKKGFFTMNNLLAGD